MKREKVENEMEHAHWIETQQYELIGYTCSNCGWDFSTSDFELDITNFEHCPHCGAKIDEEEDK